MGHRKTSGYIYIITNLINDKKYVGKTANKDPQYRWRQHCITSHGRHKNTPLYAAMRKYGISNFRFHVHLTTPNIDQAEKETIIALKSHVSKHGYNVTKGGDGGDTRYVNIDKNYLLNKLKAGSTLSQIARELDVTYETVSKRIRDFWGISAYQMRRQLGARIPQGKQVVIDECALRECILKNEKLSDTYTELGVSRKTVSRAMKAFWGTHSIRELRTQWGLPAIDLYRKPRCGAANGMWGKTHSEEAKRKMSVAKRKLEKSVSVNSKPQN